ncbi:MAG: hypothetical protein GX629_05265 [Phycisphaerae bacterium]|jgi:MFS family permease|nr:hypothetical protein [Phycisphaerae bacterium]
MVDRTNVPVGWSGESGEHTGTFKRISWGAIFAGTFVAVIIQIMLTLLGVAIGLGSISPAEGEIASEALGTGAAIWWIISTLIALFIGGWVAAHFAGVVRTIDGALHGLVTWSLAMLLIFTMLGTTLGALGTAALGTPEGRQTISRAGQQDQMSRDAGTQTPDSETDQAVKEEKAVSIASGTALAMFIMLLLGAGAAIIGGYVGSPSDIWSEDIDRRDRERMERSDRIERGERTDRVDRTDPTDRNV